MYESYDQCRIPQRPRFEWEEQFYKALSTSRDANEANAAAEWIIFSRLTESESNPFRWTSAAPWTIVFLYCEGFRWSSWIIRGSTCTSMR